MKRLMKTKGFKVTACLLILLMVLVSLPIQNVVWAKTKTLKLNESKVTMKSGETFKLKVKERPYKKSEVNDSYWMSSDETVVSVSNTGKLTAKVPGTAVITLYEYVESDLGYMSYTTECKITVKKGEFYLKKHEITMVEEDTVSLTMPDCDSITYELNYDTYPMAYLYLEEDIESSKWSIYASSYGTVYLDVSFHDAKGKVVSSDRCKITVLRKGIDTTELTRAVGKTYTFSVNGYDQSQIIRWESENPEIATVSQSGKLKAVSEGSTFVVLTVADEYGEEVDYTCEVNVSNPKLAQKAQNLAVGCSSEIDIEGLAYSSEIESVSSKPEVAEVSGQYVYAKTKGTTVITMKVDGITLKI